MTDIYDIKGIVLWLPINILYSLIILLVLIIAYWFVFKVSKKQIKQEIIIVEEPKIKNIGFKQLIEDLEKNIQIYNTEEFYHQIDKILRLYLSNKKWIQNIEKLTLKEVEQLNIDSSFIDILKSIYFKEYAKDIEDSLDTRKEYLEKIRRFEDFEDEVRWENLMRSDEK